VGVNRHERGSDPLAGVERVLIDGSNLVHALRASEGSAPGPSSAVIGPIRAAFPPTVRVELIFDGPRPGIKGRAATNVFVDFSGRRSADRVIEEAVQAQLEADGPAGTWGVLVVTDDRELRDLVQRRGARVAGTGWLATRIGRSVGPAPQRRQRGAPGSGADPGVRRPGRGGPAIGGKSGTSIGHRRPPRLGR
jgi:hypothetical protein